MIVVKSSFHYRADFDQFSTGNFVALANGAFQADPAKNTYRRLRPGVRRNAGDALNTKQEASEQPSAGQSGLSNKSNMEGK
jgi:microcystin degradation protein MlrC